LRGDLPTQLWQLTALSSLQLLDAEFQGTLPSDIERLSLLQTLDIKNTNLGGTVPTQLGKLTNFAFFVLDVQQVRGRCPARRSPPVITADNLPQQQ
jgi:Leucine-rich repeat (LRR) protein